MDLRLPKMDGWNAAYAVAFLTLLRGEDPGRLEPILTRVPNNPFGQAEGDPKPYFLPRDGSIDWGKVGPIWVLAYVEMLTGDTYGGLTRCLA